MKKILCYLFGHKPKLHKSCISQAKAGDINFGTYHDVVLDIRCLRCDGEWEHCTMEKTKRNAEKLLDAPAIYKDITKYGRRIR
jgi:hypothetical protein